MYLRILDSLVNMNKVQYVNKRYEEVEDRYTVHVSFPDGSYIDNHFETKEEADDLFEIIKQELNAITAS